MTEVGAALLKCVRGKDFSEKCVLHNSRKHSQTSDSELVEELVLFRVKIAATMLQE